MKLHKNVYLQIHCTQQISILFTSCEITVPQPSVETSHDINYQMMTWRWLGYELTEKVQTHHHSAIFSGGLQSRMAQNGQKVIPWQETCSLLFCLSFTNHRPVCTKKCLRHVKNSDNVCIINNGFWELMWDILVFCFFSILKWIVKTMKCPRVYKKMGGNSVLFSIHKWIFKTMKCQEFTRK